MRERKRPTLTVKEVIDCLSKFPSEADVYLAPSVINEDEPKETQEFILDEDKLPCVAIEGVYPWESAKIVTIGYADK